MRVLLSEKYEYLGMEDGLYIFVAKVGIERIITDQVKFIDKEKDNVIFFLPSTVGSPNIQYSYSSSERIKTGLGTFTSLGFAIRMSSNDVLPGKAAF